MQHVLTSLIVNYRATLAFFQNRDNVMKRYHPQPFPHWMRGGRHFNLIDSSQRRVIRFDYNRLIVKTEGQSTLDVFEECVKLSYDMLKDFEIADIFAIRFRGIQAKEMKSKRVARDEFAKRFLTNKALNPLPQDGLTDYAVTIERTEQVGPNFEPVGSKVSKRMFVVNQNHLLGPVEGNEIQERWLEFKESSEHELYKSKAQVPNFAQIIVTTLTLTPKKGLRQMPVRTIHSFLSRAKEDSLKAWQLTLGGL